MNIQVNSFVLFVVLGGLVYAGALVIGLAIPWELRSVFRYRLWNLRDRVKDDLFSGTLPDVPLVRHFIGALEWTIADSKNMSLLKWFLIPAASKTFKQWRDKMVIDSSAKMSAEQRRRFAVYEDEFFDIFSLHLLRGSCFGWLIFAIFMVVFLGVFVISHLWTKEVKGWVRQIAIWLKTRDRIDSINEESNGGTPGSLSGCM